MARRTPQAKQRYRERQKRIRQKKWNEMNHKRSVLMVSCIVIMLGVVLSVGSFGLHKKNMAYQKQMEVIQEQIEKEQARSEELDEMEEYVGTDEYIEDIAREKLGLVYPNEIIFVPK